MVIYLEPTAATPDTLTVELAFSDKSVHDFVVPTFKLLDYSIEELEQRNLSILLPLYLLKLRRQVSGAKSSEERHKLAPVLKKLVENIGQSIERSEKRGLINEADKRRVFGLLGMLYTDLYKSYPEFKETNTMVDDMLLTVVDKAEMAGEERGRRAEKVQLAQNLIQEGWTSEKIAVTTGLDLSTVQSLYGTAQA